MTIHIKSRFSQRQIKSKLVVRKDDMHEMSIALNIINIAEEELHKSGGEKIIGINISVGKLSGVIIESLQFALKASMSAGPLSDAQVEIDEIPAKMRCHNCNHEFEADDFYTTCPNCDAFQHEIISGKELLINSLTIQ